MINRIKSISSNHPIINFFIKVIFYYIVFYLIINFFYFLTFTQIPLAKIEKKLFKTSYPYSLRYWHSFCYYKPALGFFKTESNCDFDMQIWYNKEIIDNNLITDKKEKLDYIIGLIGWFNFRKRYSESIKYKEQAFTALQECYSKSVHFSLLIYLTESYSKLNKFNKAEKFYIKAQKLVNENKNPVNKKFSTLELLLSQASMHEDKKDYSYAEKIYRDLLNNQYDIFENEMIKSKLCELKKKTNLNNYNYRKCTKGE